MKTPSLSLRSLRSPRCRPLTYMRRESRQRIYLLFRFLSFAFCVLLFASFAVCVPMSSSLLCLLRLSHACFLYMFLSCVFCYLWFLASCVSLSSFYCLSDLCIFSKLFKKNIESRTPKSFKTRTRPHKQKQGWADSSKQQQTRASRSMQEQAGAGRNKQE